MPPVPKPSRQRSRHYVKQWRLLRGLTQEQVADRIGMSAPNYGRIENGKVPYDQDFLEATAYALRCEPADLISRDPNAEGEIVDLLAIVRDASPDQRKQIEAVVRALTAS